jgi:hypothetical protein
MHVVKIFISYRPYCRGIVNWAIVQPVGFYNVRSLKQQSVGHVSFNRKNKDRLVRNQDNVFGRVTCCFCELYHYKHLSKRVGLEQSGPRHHLIENWLVLAMIELKNCWVVVKQQVFSLTWSGLESSIYQTEANTLIITPPKSFVGNTIPYDNSICM